MKRATNDWDSAAYLQDDDDDSHQQRPSRSRRTLAHPHPTSHDSSAGPSTSRRRVPSTPTDRGRTSRRHPSTLEVSGISALAESDDKEDKLLARPRQKTRYQPSPLDEEEDLSQDNELSNSRAKKNKRPLNKPSVAKNRRHVVNVDNDEEEAELFMTQATPPKKKHKKKRRRSPSPEQAAVVTTSTNKRKDKEKVPEPEEAVTTSKKHKKHKNNEVKPHQALAKLISDQDKVLRQLAKGNQK